MRTHAYSLTNVEATITVENAGTGEAPSCVTVWTPDADVSIRGSADSSGATGLVLLPADMPIEVCLTHGDSITAVSATTATLYVIQTRPL